ncbi:hypothetical protein VYU27_009438, partial [Nannochloropsis oceanica]
PLRGQGRALYVSTFGGIAYNNNYPINACMYFDRYPKAVFSDCDGHSAADAYCHNQGYARAIDYTLTSFRTLKTPSSFIMGSQKIVEAALMDDASSVLTDVQCDQA